MRSKKSISGVIALAAVVVTPLILSGCEGSSSSTGDGSRREQITLGLPNDYTDLDPATTVSVMSDQLNLMAYDTVVSVDKSGKMIPQLAKSWTTTPDSVTLQMRDDATCADGTAVTPTVVADSLRRLADPATKSSRAYRTFGKSGVTVDADDTKGVVTITTAKPFSDLLLGLSMPWAVIVCPAGLKDPAALKEKQFGSGPYTLTKAVRGNNYTYAARSGYSWGPEGTDPAKAPKKVVLTVVGNASTMANQLVSGAVTVAAVNGPDQKRLKANKKLQESVVNPYTPNLIYINENPGHPGADPAVRKAIFQAIDPVAYNKAATGGLGHPSLSGIFTPITQCASTDLDKYIPAFDPSAVKGTLEAAGWSLTKDGLEKDGKVTKLKIVGDTATQASGPEYVLNAMTTAGFKASLKAGSEADQIGIIFKTGDWDVSVTRQGAPMPSPSVIGQFVDGVTPKEGGTDFAGIASAEWNTNSAAAQASSGDERCDYWKAAQVALVSDFHIKPLNYSDTHWFSDGLSFTAFAGGQLILPTTITSK